jgi:hypothetical protein
MIKINPATIRLLARSDSARIAFEAIGVAIAEGVKHNATTPTASKPAGTSTSSASAPTTRSPTSTNGAA